MSCKDKEKFSTSEASTKASLRTNGIIDQFLNILDTNAFRKKNKVWSANARERFGVTGNLFLEENNKAIPNSTLFKKIDLAKGKSYNGILESKSNINYSLKSIEILNSDKAKQLFEKGKKNNWALDKILTELAIPKNQKNIIIAYATLDRDEILTNLLADYSYTFEINHGKIINDAYSVYDELKDWENTSEEDKIDFYGDGKHYEKPPKRFGVILESTGSVIEWADTEEEGEEIVKRLTSTLKPVEDVRYENVKVEGGINYKEFEISIPNVIPSIKGHAEFSTENGIGWFRSDDQIKNFDKDFFNEYYTLSRQDIEKSEKTKNRRILEIQSDIFQKGRNNKNIVNTTEKDNNFLQLLNKDNNWINFFIKSIIQDSVKKGYEKVLFPATNTIAEIEGYSRVKRSITNLKSNISSYENQIKNTSDQIKINELSEKISKDTEKLQEYESSYTEQMQPVEKFYENTIQNILKKNYEVNKITDELGNDWFEVTLDSNRDLGDIFLSKVSNNSVEFNDLVFPSSDQIFGNEFNDNVDEENKVDFGDDIKNILFNGELKNTTAKEILGNIINSNIYENNSLMSNMIKKMLLSSKAQVKIVSAKELVSSDTYMQYNTNTNTIEISEENLGYVNSIEEGISKFIHEVYHDRTIRILNRPKNTDEVNLVQDINTYYNQVKNNLSSEFPHETSSIEEFTAGMFSNKDFETAVNEQLDSQSNFWKKLIDYFKKLFNLDNSYNSLLTKLVELVDITDETYTQSEIFESKYNYGRVTEKQKNQLAKIEDRIDRVIDVLVLQSNRNNNKSQFNKKINTLNKDLDKAATTLGKETNEYQKYAISNFVDFMSGQLLAIQSSFAKTDKNLDSKEFLYSKAYIQSFISIQDSIKDSLKELKSNATLTEDEYNDTLRKVNQLRGIATTLKEDLIILGKNAIKNSEYIAKEYKETLLNYTRAYREQGKKEGLKGSELEEFVNKQLASNRQLIQGDTHKEFSEMLDEAITDISAVSTWFNSEKDFTHPIIRMFSSILDKVKDKYENLVQNKLLDIQKKTSNFLNGSLTSSDTNYKNLIEWDKNGIGFIKGEYQIEYANKVNSLKDAYEFAENQEDKTKAFQNYQEWYNENTIYNEETKKRIPHPKWLNDLSTLTSKERDYLAYIKNLAEETNKLYDIDYKSLKKTTLFATYYKLPSVRKETITTIKSGELGQTAVEWYKEKFTKQSDDTEFGENLNPNEDTYKVYTDLSGKEINYIPIHYRQQIDQKHQSIDLPTIYSLEFQNASKFKEKNQVANDLVMFKEVIQEGKFTKKVGFGARVISSVYDKNNLPIEYSKEDANLIKMLDTILKTRLYDKTSEYAGKIAGQDVNKLESFVRSTVSGSSMALNLIGAPANWVTGKNQSFLEVIRDPNLHRSNLLKAEKYYTNNIGGMMDDLGRNVYKSLPNQLLLSYGGLVSSQMLQNSFEKGKALSLLSHGKPLYFFQEAPEHHITAVHTMTILDSAKILDKDGNYLDKEGNITNSKTAASLLDISKLENGLLTTSIKTPFYTTIDRLNEFDKEGRGNVRSYIQASLIKSQGNYGSEYTAELQRKFYGKALFHFKKHVISPTLSRWRGIATNLSADESKIILNYDFDLQRPDEGNYVTTLRFIKNVFLPKLKGFQMNLIQQDWREMDDWEKANIKRTLTEVSMALAMMSLAMLFAGAAKAEGGDDDALWYAASVFRRLQSEQTQYFDITETWRIANNPISTLNLLQDTASFGSATLNLFNPFSEDKLENLEKKSIKMTKYIPGSKLFKESKDSYNYMNRN